MGKCGEDCFLSLEPFLPHCFSPYEEVGGMFHSVCFYRVNLNYILIKRSTRIGGNMRGEKTQPKPESPYIPGISAAIDASPYL